MRGGARRGAGRKPTENHRVTICLNVSPETKALARVLRERGVKVNRLVEVTIAEIFWRSCNSPK